MLYDDSQQPYRSDRRILGFNAECIDVSKADTQATKMTQALDDMLWKLAHSGSSATDIERNVDADLAAMRVLQTCERSADSVPFGHQRSDSGVLFESPSTSDQNGRVIKGLQPARPSRGDACILKRRRTEGQAPRSGSTGTKRSEQRHGGNMSGSRSNATGGMAAAPRLRNGLQVVPGMSKMDIWAKLKQVNEAMCVIEQRQRSRSLSGAIAGTQGHPVLDGTTSKLHTAPAQPAAMALSSAVPMRPAAIYKQLLEAKRRPQGAPSAGAAGACTGAPPLVCNVLCKPPVPLKPPAPSVPPNVHPTVLQACNGLKAGRDAEASHQQPWVPLCLRVAQLTTPLAEAAPECWWSATPDDGCRWGSAEPCSETGLGACPAHPSGMAATDTPYTVSVGQQQPRGGAPALGGDGPAKPATLPASSSPQACGISANRPAGPLDSSVAADLGASGNRAAALPDSCGTSVLPVPQQLPVFAALRLSDLGHCDMSSGNTSASSTALLRLPDLLMLQGLAAGAAAAEGHVPAVGPQGVASSWGAVASSTRVRGCSDGGSHGTLGSWRSLSQGGQSEASNGGYSSSAFPGSSAGGAPPLLCAATAAAAADEAQPPALSMPGPAHERDGESATAQVQVCATDLVQPVISTCLDTSCRMEPVEAGAAASTAAACVLMPVVVEPLASTFGASLTSEVESMAAQLGSAGPPAPTAAAHDQHQSCIARAPSHALHVSDGQPHLRSPLTPAAEPAAPAAFGLPAATAVTAGLHPAELCPAGYHTPATMPSRAASRSSDLTQQPVSAASRSQGCRPLPAVAHVPTSLSRRKVAYSTRAGGYAASTAILCGADISLRKAPSYGIATAASLRQWHNAPVSTLGRWPAPDTSSMCHQRFGTALPRRTTSPCHAVVRQPQLSGRTPAVPAPTPPPCLQGALGALGVEDVSLATIVRRRSQQRGQRWLDQELGAGALNAIPCSAPCSSRTCVTRGPHMPCSTSPDVTDRLPSQLNACRQGTIDRAAEVRTQHVAKAVPRTPRRITHLSPAAAPRVGASSGRGRLASRSPQGLWWGSSLSAAAIGGQCPSPSAQPAQAPAPASAHRGAVAQIKQPAGAPTGLGAGTAPVQVQPWDQQLCSTTYSLPQILQVQEAAAEQGALGRLADVLVSLLTPAGGGSSEGRSQQLATLQTLAAAQLRACGTDCLGCDDTHASSATQPQSAAPPTQLPHQRCYTEADGAVPSTDADASAMHTTNVPPAMSPVVCSPQTHTSSRRSEEQMPALLQPGGATTAAATSHPLQHPVQPTSCSPRGSLQVTRRESACTVGAVAPTEGGYAAKLRRSQQAALAAVAGTSSSPRAMYPEASSPSPRHRMTWSASALSAAKLQPPQSAVAASAASQALSVLGVGGRDAYMSMPMDEEGPIIVAATLPARLEAQGPCPEPDGVQKLLYLTPAHHPERLLCTPLWPPLPAGSGSEDVRPATPLVPMVMAPPTPVPGVSLPAGCGFPLPFPTVLSVSATPHGQALLAELRPEVQTRNQLLQWLREGFQMSAAPSAGGCSIRAPHRQQVHFELLPDRLICVRRGGGGLGGLWGRERRTLVDGLGFNITRGAGMDGMLELRHGAYSTCLQAGGTEQYASIVLGVNAALLALGGPPATGRECGEGMLWDMPWHTSCTGV